jgi:hypothetical protein
MQATAKFKLLIFSVSGFILSYTANMFILVILHALFCYILVYIRKVESRVHIADRCELWKIYSRGKNLVL